MLRVGSLCSGYGGLEMAISDVFGETEIVFVADIDKGACKILEHRFPGIPNLGDISKTGYDGIGAIDVLTAGFPCQDVSAAGARRGLRAGTRSGVWSEVARAVDLLRPPLVFIENVHGLLSAKADSYVEWCPGCMGDGSAEPFLRGLGAVLGDLAEIGYDAEWTSVRASDVGAPHRRSRVFILGFPQDPDGAAGGERRVPAS